MKGWLDQGSNYDHAANYEHIKRKYLRSMHPIHSSEAAGMNRKEDLDASSEPMAMPLGSRRSGALDADWPEKSQGNEPSSAPLPIIAPSVHLSIYDILVSIISTHSNCVCTDCYTQYYHRVENSDSDLRKGPSKLLRAREPHYKQPTQHSSNMQVQCATI